MVKRMLLPPTAMVMTLAACLLSLGTLGTMAKPAEAAFPGDNGKIVFTSDRDGNNEIYAINPDGANPVNLTHSPGDDISAAPSPDGKKIVFVSLRDGNSEIYTMDADGSNQTRLTDNPAIELWPAFSPDGSKIAFTSFRDGNHEIYTMDAADGSDQVNITNHPASDRGPAWSPDGSQIAFSSRRDGNSEVYTMDADGSDPKNRSENPAYDSSAQWSPDGSRIAFYTERDGNSEIYAMNADGTDQTNLTNDTGVLDDSPAFSPDGTKIAFHKEDPSDNDNDLYVMDADGSNPTPLTGDPASAVCGDQNDFDPAWQPGSGPQVDKLRPSVDCKEPNSGETVVARNISPTVTFSEEMKPNTLNASTVKLYERKSGKWRRVADVAVGCDNPCQATTIDPYPSDPARLLAANKKYKAVVTTGAKDKAGNALAKNHSWTFTTGSA